MTTFSAAHDPWIPVMAADGERLVSLREALCDAHSLTGLATGDPLADVALTRILVALLLRTHPIDGADDLADLLAAGHLDTDAITTYLDHHAERFDVFGNHPWMQAKGLSPMSGKGHSSTNTLRLEAPSGNNVPLFATALAPHAAPMTLPQALVRMLTLQAWDTAGIKTGMAGDPQAKAGKTTGNRTGLVGSLGVVLLLGRTLFDTLVLNTPADAPDDGHDKPTWEHDTDVTWQTRPAHGPMDLLTWQSRRIELVTNGDTVIGALVGAGDRITLLDPALEPHTRWRAVTGRDVPHTPVRWQPGRSAWRGLESLVALQPTPDKLTASHTVRQLAELEDELGLDYPLRALCVGIEYGSQSAVVESVMVDQLPLPLAAVRVDTNPHVAAAIGELSRIAEAIRRALNDLDSNVRKAQGGDKLGWDQGRHPGDEAMSQLTLPTHRLLTGLQTHPDQVAELMAAWRAEVRRITLAVADTICDGANPNAFAGRAITLADAEAWFRKTLHEHLPWQAPPPTADTQEGLDEDKETR